MDNGERKPLTHHLSTQCTTQEREDMCRGGGGGPLAVVVVGDVARQFSIELEDVGLLGQILAHHLPPLEQLLLCAR